jgi:hypothetical protein
MATSRIRLVADRMVLSLSDTAAGSLVFEEGIVGGVSGLVLRSALIGDLTVDTLQMADACVTLPAIQTLGSSFAFSVGGATWQTFLQDTFTLTSPNGSTVFLQLQGDILLQGQNTVTPSARLLLNDTTVLDQFDGVADTASRRFTRFAISSFTATGSVQTVDLKWQLTSSAPNNFSVSANAGSRTLRIAMKR